MIFEYEKQKLGYFVAWSNHVNFGLLFLFFFMEFVKKYSKGSFEVIWTISFFIESVMWFSIIYPKFNLIYSNLEQIINV